jgi:hypothetical protein
MTGLRTSTALLDNYGLGHRGVGNVNWRMCGHGCPASFGWQDAPRKLPDANSAFENLKLRRT